MHSLYPCIHYSFEISGCFSIVAVCLKSVRGALHISQARRYWIGSIVMYGVQWINLFAPCSCGLKPSPLLWDDILSAQEHSRFVLTMTDNGLRKVCSWTWLNSQPHLLRRLKIYWIKNRENALQGKSLPLCIHNLSFQDFASCEE